MRQLWVFVTILWFALASCHDAQRDTEPEHAPADDPVASLKRNAAGEPVITINAETQHRIALRVETLAAATQLCEVRGYGRTLDPAPLAALQLELRTAQVSSVASSREYERLKALNAQDQNASLRAVQIAEATAQHDQIILESVRDRLALGWGKTLAERPDLAKLISSLCAHDAALVRVDLPVGAATTPTGARILPLTNGEEPIDAQLLGPMPSIELQLQGQGFLLLLNPNVARLMPGAAVSAQLQLPGAAETGVVVPRSAVVRAEGRAWVYVQTGAESFTRREIALGNSLAAGWFLPSALAPHDPLVVSGAQVLLSEELKSRFETE